jgi:predicted RNA-binding protein YlxR (DUF448 family)
MLLLYRKEWNFMTNKKPTLRRCIACNEQREKKDLLRLVKPKDRALEIDLTGKKNGRGAYICKKEECLNKAIKTKKLERVFEISIDSEFYESVRGVIIE